MSEKVTFNTIRAEIIKGISDIPVYTEQLFEIKEFPCVIIAYDKTKYEYHGSRKKTIHHYCFSVIDKLSNHGSEKEPESYKKAQNLCYEKASEILDEILGEFPGMQIAELVPGEDIFMQNRICMSAGILEIAE